MIAHLRRAGHLAAVEGLPDVHGIPSRYVALLPNGPMVVLAGTASIIWDTIGNGAEATLPARVAVALEGISADDIEADVRAFVDQLVKGGFLERYDAVSEN